jgi:hypothetical protein
VSAVHARIIFQLRAVDGCVMDAGVLSMMKRLEASLWPLPRAERKFRGVREPEIDPSVI